VVMNLALAKNYNTVHQHWVAAPLFDPTIKSCDIAGIPAVAVT